MRLTPITRRDSADLTPITRRDFTGSVPSSSVVKLESGAIRVPTRATRTGVFVYVLEDGTERREYRPPEEVFAAESLESMRDAPVTIGHPPEAMSADLWPAVAVGHIGGAGAIDESFVRVPVVVCDAEAIAGVASRDLIETSMGYRALFDPVPGTTPDGEPYDGIQRRIRYNHVALLGAGEGRAGSEVRLLLDSRRSASAQQMEITINGKKVVRGSAEHLAELEKMHAAAEAKAIADAARADAAEKATTDARASASRRANVLSLARAFLPERYADAEDPAVEASGNSAVLADVIKMKFPAFKPDGKSEDFLLGIVFAMAMTGGGAPAPGAAPPASDATPTTPEAPAASPPGAPKVDPTAAARDSILALREGVADANDDPIAVAVAERQRRNPQNQVRLVRGGSQS